jgi:hypothetical protein
MQWKLARRVLLPDFSSPERGWVAHVGVCLVNLKDRWTSRSRRGWAAPPRCRRAACGKTQVFFYFIIYYVCGKNIDLDIDIIIIFLSHKTNRFV